MLPTFIANENELQVTQDRIAHFERLLTNLQHTARPDELEAVTSGYRLEIERMQAAMTAFLSAPDTNA